MTAATLEALRTAMIELDESRTLDLTRGLLLDGTSSLSAGYYDDLPTEGNEGGQAFRDLEWKKKVEQICRESGVGAQFGGKYFVHDVREFKLAAPRSILSGGAGS